MVQVALLGIITGILSLWFKQQKPEYSLYLGLASSLLILMALLSRVEVILEVLKKLEDYLGIESEYLKLLMKMLGITYLAQFASDICKDCGLSTLSSQISIYAKLLLLGLSMPIVLSLIDTIWKLLPGE
jgi:stage III sporulation protein AD